MVLLRCTKKLLAVLGGGVVVESAGASDPQDWYANLVSVDGRTCLLLTHAGTLFTLLASDVRVRELWALHGVVVGLVERELAAENLPADTFGRLNHEDLRIAATADRSVLGCMNDMAFLAGELIARAEASSVRTSARSIVRCAGTSTALGGMPARSILHSSGSTDHHNETAQHRKHHVGAS